MKLYRTAMGTVVSTVVVGVFASPNSAIADGNCAAITGTSATQMTGNPDWPTTEPFGWFTGTPVRYRDQQARRDPPRHP